MVFIGESSPNGRNSFRLVKYYNFPIYILSFIRETAWTIWNPIGPCSSWPTIDFCSQRHVHHQVVISPSRCLPKRRSLGKSIRTPCLALSVACFCLRLGPWIRWCLSCDLVWDFWQKINLCFRFTFLTSSDLRNSNLLCTCLHHREDWLKIMHKSAETMTVVERFPRLFSDGLLLKRASETWLAGKDL